MARVTERRRTPRAQQRALAKLSPFELKDRLIDLAAEHARRDAHAMLNAGRGNPNWLATTPREAFFTLGAFALEEARRGRHEPGLGGLPDREGIASRFRDFAERQRNAPGMGLLRAGVDYGVERLGFEPDGWVHALTDAVLGDKYPSPDRMLPHAERVVHEYLVQEMCAGRAPAGRYDLFAVEGGTAAVCYIFDSLATNGLLRRGDKIALAAPIFAPYVEIPRLERYRLRVVYMRAREHGPDGSHTWQYPDAEIDRLADPSIKALFAVNPGNPTSVAIRPRTMARLVALVARKRPDLMIITDDVYGTFVDGFRSLMAELPRNTIGVYSYSKYFGCTGWRLGVIAIHEDNVFDTAIRRLPAGRRRDLARRYGGLTLHPGRMKFIDRLVADSRHVALHHTAGLSLPQQAQMVLFSLSALLDTAGVYKKLAQDICRRRLKALWEGMGQTLPEDAHRAAYYADIDLMDWARQQYGPGFARFLADHYPPADILFRLAGRSSVVLLNGGAFAGPQWSLRVSLANLPDEAYGQIGRYLKEAATEYTRTWQAARRARPARGGRRRRAAPPSD
jgi:aspartate 4-decarboxylase